MDFMAAFNTFMGNNNSNNPRDQRLFRAALGGDLDRLEKLIKSDADVNAEYESSRIEYVPFTDNIANIPLIHFAAIACRPEVIRFLTSKKAKLSSQYTVNVDETSNIYTGPILHNVVYYIGDQDLGFEKIQFLLENYTLDVNKPNAYGKTLLDAAIVKKSVNMKLLSYLLIEKQAKFSPDLLPDLLARVYKEKLELTILNECLLRGLDVTTAKNGNVLHYLATVVDHSVGLPEILDTMRTRYTTEELCTLVNESDEDGRTPLSLYAGHRYYRVHKDFFNFLIEHGADVNTQDNKGNTPLMYAGLAQKRNICQQLIASGADLDMQNYSDDTAIDLAIEANPALLYLLSQIDVQEFVDELEPEPELEPELVSQPDSSVRLVMK